MEKRTRCQGELREGRRCRSLQRFADVVATACEYGQQDGKVHAQHDKPGRSLSVSVLPILRSVAHVKLHRRALEGGSGSEIAPYRDQCALRPREVG